MATYVYETIPQKKGQKSRRFEVEQKMSDDPLTHDPKTGMPCKRIIVGGSGWVTHGRQHSFHERQVWALGRKF